MKFIRFILFGFLARLLHNYKLRLRNCTCILSNGHLQLLTVKKRCEPSLITTIREAVIKKDRSSVSLSFLLILRSCKI